jgi:hypothetical protein
MHAEEPETSQKAPIILQEDRGKKKNARSDDGQRKYLIQGGVLGVRRAAGRVDKIPHRRRGGGIDAW